MKHSKADIHIHTTFSDGLNEPEAVVNFVATQTDLRVIAITDHNTVDGARAAYAYWRKNRALFGRLEVIIGSEISTSVGHIIGLFLKEDVPARMSPEETIWAIHEQGGLAIAAHPFTHLLPFTDFEGVGRRIGYLPIDGVEERSSIPTELYANWITAVYNQNHRQVARLGSSDAHYLTMIGKTYTWFPGETARHFRRAVELRTTRAGGRINGPIAIWQVLSHLYRKRQLRHWRPNDREYVHQTKGLQIQTVERPMENAIQFNLCGQIDSTTADFLKESGARVLMSGVADLRLNLAQVTFVDSIGMGALLSIHKMMGGAHGRLGLLNLQPQVYKTIRLLRLDKLFALEQETTPRHMVRSMVEKNAV